MSPTKLCCRLRILCLVVCLTAGAPGLCAQPGPPAAHLFDFHSGFWINLHHFLYCQAILSQPQKSPGSLALIPSDRDEQQHLSSAEQQSWNAALTFYADKFAKRDLLFDADLIVIKDQLEDAEASDDLADTQIPADVKAVLLRAAPIYKTHWWPRHDAANRKWIEHLKPLLAQHGSTLSAALVRAYDQPWPQYPVRVDAVAYSNWAGAYTTLHPTRPTISSTDPANQGNAALEIVFHETTHGMMDKVMDSIQSEEANLNTQHPKAHFHTGSIWHGVLFYTAGELVAEQIPGYVPYADKNGLWTRAWPAPDRSLIVQNWKPHLTGSVTLQQSLAKLVDDLAAAPPNPPTD